MDLDLAPGALCEEVVTGIAIVVALGVGEDDADGVFAFLALDLEEVGVGGGNGPLEFVSSLFDVVGHVE